MRPNIDRKGRIARAISGSLCILVGPVLWWIGWPPTPTVRLILGLVAVAAGGFQLFEARRSWCIVRACGIRTPM